MRPKVPGYKFAEFPYEYYETEPKPRSNWRRPKAQTPQAKRHGYDTNYDPVKVMNLLKPKVESHKFADEPYYSE